MKWRGGNQTRQETFSKLQRLGWLGRYFLGLKEFLSSILFRLALPFSTKDHDLITRIQHSFFGMLHYCPRRSENRVLDKISY